MRETLQAVMAETYAVGHAEGARSADRFRREPDGLLDTLPETMQASMLHDLQAGKPLELPGCPGGRAACRKRHAIATPVNRTIVAALKPYVGGTPA